MAGTNGNDIVQQVLESAQNPSREASQLRKQWRDKSPHETVAASRKLFYGAVVPSLTNGEPLDQDTIQQIEALFETTFSQIEQSAMTSRSASRGSSS